VLEVCRWRLGRDVDGDVDVDRDWVGDSERVRVRRRGGVEVGFEVSIKGVRRDETRRGEDIS
jgi:hypothetical protein